MAGDGRSWDQQVIRNTVAAPGACGVGWRMKGKSQGFQGILQVSNDLKWPESYDHMCLLFVFGQDF